MGSRELVWCFLWGLLFGVAAPVTAIEAEVDAWQIQINIPECCLRLYYREQLIKDYRVAVGKPETPSPQGEFRIITKVTNPTWYPGKGRQPVPSGPANPLGRFWLGLDRKGYGIHGNNQATSVGLPVSHGCFRMANADIEELFRWIPTGVRVIVNYQPVSGWVDQNQHAFLTCFPDLYRQTDRFREACTVLQQLDWNYQVHYGALAALLTHYNTATFNVPRQIKVVGSGAARDGFCWEDSLFVKVANQDGVVESKLFPGYALISVTGGLTVKYRFDWDAVAGVLDMKPLLLGKNVRRTGN